MQTLLSYRAVTLALILLGGLGLHRVQAQEPIRIGAIVELTGEAAEMGIENQHTIDVAVNLLNQAGGIEGYPVEVTMVDGASDPAVFATKAHRLVEDAQVLAGIGGNDISFATSAGEVFAKNKTPYADIGGTTPTIPLISDFMFMAPGPDNDQGRAVAMYAVQKLNYDTFAIFKDVASAYGTKLTEYFIYYAKHFTGKDDPVPLVLTYQTGDTDYSAQLTRLKLEAAQKGVQAVVLPTWPQDAPTIAKQARDLGIDLPLIGTDGVDTSALTEVGGEAVEGMVYSTHFHPDQPGLPMMARQFVNAYRRKFNDDPGAFGTMGYDALMIMAEAIGAAIKEKGRVWWDQAGLAEKRLATRDKLLDVTFAWTTQPFKFTPEGWPQKGVVWKMVQNGKRNFHYFQPYASFSPAGVDVLPFK
ncbi:MAG: ABC transporter substrate-binding protein [Desulfobacterales bacterium]|nr:MAG: ABC transporter substrate-binding protein [Desulfobacterales bacterium]